MNTKKISRTALLLALAVASQFLKNLSVYITGPIINCILIIAVIYCGLGSAAFLSVVLPVTSWLITASPIITSMPVIMPCIMAGNFILVYFVWLFMHKEDTDKRLIAGLISGCIVKAAFMAITISLLVLQLMGPGSGLPEAALNMAKVTFSVTQLTTGLIGAALAFAVKKALDKAINSRAE